ASGAGDGVGVPEAGATSFAARADEAPEEPRVARVPEPRVTRVATRSSGRRARPVPAVAVVTHRVRPGQTLSEIAKEHNVSVQRLASANRIQRARRLRVGQVLKIPISPSATQSPT